MARELARYKLGLVGVQEVRWEKGSAVKAGDYIFFQWKRKRKSSIGNRIFVHHRIISSIKRAGFLIDRMSYIVLRGRWCIIVVLKVLASTEEKSGDSKTVFIRN